MDSYSVWLHNLDFFDTAHDDNPDDTVNTAECDGSDPDEDDMEPIFRTDNTVPRGTLDFSNNKSKECKKNRTVPDPACGPMLPNTVSKVRAHTMGSLTPTTCVCSTSESSLLSHAIIHTCTQTVTHFTDSCFMVTHFIDS